MKINEIFKSIQGEGKHIGKPQVFVRLAGCNLKCKWCDTKQAWDTGEELNIDEILNIIKAYEIKSVCITGGEPLIQKTELFHLINLLKDLDYEIILETNGTINAPKIFYHVDCVSMDIKPPSSGEASDELLINFLTEKDQVKIIISNDEDFEFMKRFSKKDLNCELVVQPENGFSYNRLTERILSENLQVRILPQLHKIFDLK